jgi:uncharacterized membrane protein YobD (UPF0266 family)
MIEILVIALTFALCFAVDKLYTKLFRSRSHHKTGKAVRLSRRNAILGIVFSAIGLIAIVVGLSESLFLSVGGALVVLFGIGLIVYYCSFGIFYDHESFLLSTFGKPSQVYYFRDITSQQLYVIQGGSYLVELYLKDGRSVSIQSTMDGFKPFLNHAWEAWLTQQGKRAEDCEFHDPDHYIWFPPMEV